uniref:NR LBD domain-containing protein n=1 Tax=Caenorhabditis tropicalis TaxID=1561998 RepID=A0A1I7TI51_9PELO
MKKTTTNKEERSNRKRTVWAIIVNTLINETVFKSNDELVCLFAAFSCTHQKSTSIASLPETADEYAKRGSEIFETYKLYRKTPKSGEQFAGGNLNCEDEQIPQPFSSVYPSTFCVDGQES